MYEFFTDILQVAFVAISAFNVYLIRSFAIYRGKKKLRKSNKIILKKQFELIKIIFSNIRSFTALNSKSFDRDSYSVLLVT